MFDELSSDENVILTLGKREGVNNGNIVSIIEASASKINGLLAFARFHKRFKKFREGSRDSLL